jgi:hypothetical protein
MEGTNPTSNQAQTQIQPTLPYMVGLNLPDLTKLLNDVIQHNATLLAMLTKLPSDIPNFEVRARQNPSNHIMSFHLCCSSNSIMDDSIRLWLFECTLTCVDIKWYIDQLVNTHSTFDSTAKVFLIFFQLLVHYDVEIKILTTFHQTTTTHIMDHIHQWCR